VGLTFSDLLIALVKGWRAMLVLPLAIAIAVLGVSLLIRNVYTASIGLVPETRAAGTTGQLAGLAALAGVNLGTLGTSESPQFYAAILESRPIGYLVLNRRYSTTGLDDDLELSDSLTLVDILKPKGKTPSEHLWQAYKRLHDNMLDVGVDLRSGIIHLSVRYSSPRLAADIANAFADELLQFNAETRQTMAGKRRRFIEARTAEASQELSAREAAVRDFLERNRQYEGSPTLRFELSRLQRNLTVQQDLYLDLRRQLEGARIAEVDDVPALTVVERAIPPQRKSGPKRVLYLMISFFLTLFVVTLWTIVGEYQDRLFPGFNIRLAAVAPSLSRFVRGGLARAGVARP
jgi:uncharacterized protein involved in exopolysaccharide biosynthesis